jgi:hypothetical protein
MQRAASRVVVPKDFARCDIFDTADGEYAGVAPTRLSVRKVITDPEMQPQVAEYQSFRRLLEF